MSVERRNNRHYAWIRYREECAGTFAEIGLPVAAYKSEHAFARFLDTGRTDDVDLDSLPDPHFWKLFDIANSWFDYSTMGFVALERRRLRGRETAG